MLILTIDDKPYQLPEGLADAEFGLLVRALSQATSLEPVDLDIPAEELWRRLEDGPHVCLEAVDYKRILDANTPATGFPSLASHRHPVDASRPETLAELFERDAGEDLRRRKFNSRIVNALILGGVDTVADLVGGHKLADICSFKGIGFSSLERIHEIVERLENF